MYVEGLGWIPAETVDRTGSSFGRDRNKSPFFTKHFDFVSWNLTIYYIVSRSIIISRHVISHSTL